MSLVSVALQLIPLVLDLIVAAERLYDAKGSGAQKKEAVKLGVGSAVAAAEACGAKISPQSKEALIGVTDKAIDVFVDWFNRAGWPPAVTPPGNA
jgi:hypothetical protein